MVPSATRNSETRKFENRFAGMERTPNDMRSDPITSKTNPIVELWMFPFLFILVVLFLYYLKLSFLFVFTPE